MNIAVFGGSFDPIHKGHLEIITKLFDDFHMDKVIVIPTNVSYYKNCVHFVFSSLLLYLYYTKIFSKSQDL